MKSRGTLTANQPPAPTLGEEITKYIGSKRKTNTGRGGNYVSLAKPVLEQFQQEIAKSAGSEITIAEIGTTDCKEYTLHLQNRWENGEIVGETGQTYYNIVAAFFSWCVRHGFLDANPALDEAVREHLPPTNDETNDQFVWSETHRIQLINHVRDRIGRIENGELDPTHLQRIKSYRDHALVMMIAFTGLRIGEICRNPADARRRGITWSDVNMSENTVRVLGKSQTWEQAPLPNPAVSALEAYEHVCYPPSEDWPVFQTQMRPTRSNLLEDELKERGYHQQERETIRESAPTYELLREYDVRVPAITTEGARSILKQLCDDADISIDDADVDYLEPHGARRFIGDKLYRQHPSKAQAALRHQSIETTKKSYSYIDLGEIAGDIEQALTSSPP